MAPITWKNINAPSFRDSMVATAMAGKSFEDAGSNLQRILTEGKRVGDANWDNQAAINTDEINAQRAKITDLGQLITQENNFLPAALQEQYGRQYLQPQVKAEGEALRGKLTKEQVTANTNKYLQSLQGIDFNKVNPADILNQATAKYGEHVDLDQVRSVLGDGTGFADRMFNREDTLFDQSYKSSMLASQQADTVSNQQYRSGMLANSTAERALREEAAKHKDPNTYKVNSDGSVTTIAPGGVVMRNTSPAILQEKGIAAARKLDEDANQGFWTGWLKPNASEEALRKTGADIAAKEAAAERISNMNATGGYNANSSVTQGEGPTAPYTPESLISSVIGKKPTGTGGATVVSDRLAAAQKRLAELQAKPEKTEEYYDALDAAFSEQLKAEAYGDASDTVNSPEKSAASRPAKSTQSKAPVYSPEEILRNAYTISNKNVPKSNSKVVVQDGADLMQQLKKAFNKQRTQGSKSPWEYYR